MRPEVITDFDPVHHFSAGVYIRQQHLLADYVVTTHKHNFDHFGLLGSGSARVEVDGAESVHTGPCVIEIKAGKTHRITSITDITWFCIHATDATDPAQVDHETLEV